VDKADILIYLRDTSESMKMVEKEDDMVKSQKMGIN